MVLKNAILFFLMIFVLGCATALAPRCPAGSDDAVTKARKLKEVAVSKSLKNGFIGTVIQFPGSEVEKSWRAIYDVAVSRYPNLHFTPPEDLHLTVIYVGAWSLENIDQIIRIASVRPNRSMSLTPSLKRFGKKLLVMSLPGVDDNWIKEAESARLKLNTSNLRDVGPLDFSFDPHLSLASTKAENPSTSELTELDGFEAWLKTTDLLNQYIYIGPESDFRVIVTESSKPQNAPTFYPVDEYLSYEIGQLGGSKCSLIHK